MDKTELLATLGLTVSFLDLIERNVKQGRLKGYIGKLKKGSQYIIQRNHWERRHIQNAKNIIIEFGERSDWNNKPVRTVTYTNLLLILLERTPYWKLIKYCNEIVDYFNRSGKDYSSDYSEAVEVSTIWDQIIEEKKEV